MDLLVYGLIIVAAALAVVAVALALLICIPWYLMRDQVVAHIEYAPPLIIGRRRVHAGAESCQFETSDGLTLQGAYFRTPAHERLGVIVFAHELHGDRWTSVEYVRDLVENGFDVLAFDFRCHGDSDRMENYEPMCWLTEYETKDMQAAVDYACSLPDADPEGVGVIGISRGAAAALCVAAEDSRVRALVCDGPIAASTIQVHFIRRFVTIHSRIGQVLARMPGYVLGWVAAVGRMVVQRRQNCKFANIEQAATDVEQPVLLIQGERDKYVPVEVTKKLRNSLAGRSRLWVVPKAKHNAAITVATSEYRRRIWRFFSHHSVRPRPVVLPMATAAAVDVEPAMVGT
ncbi:MAG: alpha/beta fold hydrolase [Pirellulales bacterium]|nr:alpha/beta fold hydrolase [Pirellulales bacterium]